MPATKKKPSAKKPARKKATRTDRPVQPESSQETPMMAALRAEHRHMASVMELMSQQLDAVAKGDLVAAQILAGQRDLLVGIYLITIGLDGFRQMFELERRAWQADVRAAPGLDLKLG